MQFERIKKSHKKKIIIGGLIIVCVISAITITTTRAKYKLTQDIPLVRGTVNYKMPDMRVVAVNTSEDGTNYNIVDEIPTEGYNFNSEKSVCKVATETSGIENAPKDNNITIGEAMDIVYNSRTFEKLNDLETHLYYESSAYVYEMLKEELQNKVIY